MLFWLAISAAHAAGLSPERQALLLCKVASYDRSEASEDPFHVVVVFDSNDAASVSHQKDLAGALNALVGRVEVGGRSIVVSAVAEKSLEQLPSLRPDALYITRGLGSSGVSAVLEHARSLHSPTYTSETALFEQGVGIGLLAKAGKPELHVNLAQVRTEGADFASSFLSVASVH